MQARVSLRQHLHRLQVEIRACPQVIDQFCISSPLLHWFVDEVSTSYGALRRLVQHSLLERPWRRPHRPTRYYRLLSECASNHLLIIRQDRQFLAVIGDEE